MQPRDHAHVLAARLRGHLARPSLSTGDFTSKNYLESCRQALLAGDLAKANTYLLAAEKLDDGERARRLLPA